MVGFPFIEISDMRMSDYFNQLLALPASGQDSRSVPPELET
jgi:hypothetical protein